MSVEDERWVLAGQSGGLGCKVGLFRCILKTQGQDSLRESRSGKQSGCTSARKCICLDTGYYAKLVLCGVFKSNLLAIQRNAATAVCVPPLPARKQSDEEALQVALDVDVNGFRKRGAVTLGVNIGNLANLHLQFR